MMSKKTNKKVKLHDCAHVHFYYDDLDRGILCEASGVGRYHCNCSGILLRNFCPYFKPDEKELVEITITDSDRKEVDEYRDRLRGEVREMLNTVNSYIPRINKILDTIETKKELLK